MPAQKITAPYGATKAHKSGKDRGADMVTFWLKDPRHYSISTPAEEKISTTASTIHLITLKHTKQAAKLDNCLLTLADGHDHVMKAMIGELRDIADAGYEW